jgi:hypothetical protein
VEALRHAPYVAPVHLVQVLPAHALLAPQVPLALRSVQTFASNVLSVQFQNPVQWSASAAPLVPISMAANALTVLREASARAMATLTFVCQERFQMSQALRFV